MNLYEYAAGNPLGVVDTYGLTRNRYHYSVDDQGRVIARTVRYRDRWEWGFKVRVADGYEEHHADWAEKQHVRNGRIETNDPDVLAAQAVCEARHDSFYTLRDRVREEMGASGVDFAVAAAVPGGQAAGRIVNAVGDAAGAAGAARRVVRAAQGSVRSANSTFQYGNKIRREMGPRGWTDSLVDEAISRPHATSAATNKATGGRATAYFRQDESHVVRDNASREIIQVSNRNNPKWIPDSSIQHPYYPK